MNRLLFVEGERLENQITKTLTKVFLSTNTVITCAYCNDIYELHKEIVQDEDLDTYVLLREISKNKETLSSYNRSDFAEIYLFFDYDGHDEQASDEKIKEVLAFFNEETSKGKRFLSYPMVEALKHLSNENDFKELKVKARENINCKNIVSNIAKTELKQVNKYNQNT